MREETEEDEEAEEEEVQIGDLAISHSGTLAIYSGIFISLGSSRKRSRIKGLAFKCLRLHSIGVTSVSLCTHWNGRPFFPRIIPPDGVLLLSMIYKGHSNNSLTH